MNVIVATITTSHGHYNRNTTYIIALVANAFGCLFSLHTGNYEAVSTIVRVGPELGAV